MIKLKIKITDDPVSRKILNAEYDVSSKIDLCKYSLLLARHILELTGYKDLDNEMIKEGFLINESYQEGKARMYDVRCVGFKIHKMAKECDDEIYTAALRVLGHAISSAHMKEHAMVASDYSIKVINLLYPGNAEKVKEERSWQINCLKNVRGERKL